MSGALMRRTTVTALVVALLAGCRVGPDYEPPETTLPDMWQERAARGVRTGEAALQTWWEVFEDPLLTELIVRAEQANLDLRRAVGRIREARALVRVSSGQKWPEFNASGEAARSAGGIPAAVRCAPAPPPSTR